MSKSLRTYVRFSITQRVEHLVMLLSFTLLGMSGLPQKYPTNNISEFLVNLFGGIENIRRIHHISAVILMLVTVYHLITTGYKIFVERRQMSILPSFQDIRNAWQAFLYNIDLSKSRPQMRRYTFEEKTEYWALVWGVIIMGLTGFLMWNPIASAQILPGEFIPAAKAAHGAEAVLAVLAIFVWHMYGVHLKWFNKAMWTGRLTEEEMLHEHPLELADIKAGITGRVLNPVTLRKRRMVFIPIAGILTVVMLAGVYGFVNGEKTAITTIPPQPSPIAIYVPQTPTPIPTVIPTVSVVAPDLLTWDSYISPLLQQKCSACHGTMAGLSFMSYADAIRGSTKGPVILPGDGIKSNIYIVQSAGGHLGQLNADELAKLKEWIDLGAPEK